jgi:predicted MFS family arabinose efflux permease
MATGNEMGRFTGKVTANRRSHAEVDAFVLTQQPEKTMTLPLAGASVAPTPRSASWGAVFALTLCVSTLIASEFMPVSLLTPIASDLHLSEGGAGQAIAVSGLFAVVTSLFIASVAKAIDRRKLLLGLTGLMLVSGLVVALAPNFTVLMIGRALLGVVIGGFWSLSAATVMRLVPEEDVPRALALLNGGNALATTVAAPLGSFLGQYIGWRGAFFVVVPLAAITLVWQYFTLPGMPTERAAPPPSAFAVLRRPKAPAGILAVTLLFMGQFALFTYLRPFLETVTRVGVSTLSLLLLGMGAAGLLGTYLIGFFVARRLSAVLIAAPLAMAVIAVVLVVLGRSLPATALLLAGWGLIGTAVPVAWWTWLSRTLPHDAEAGGGLMVAAVQLAITAGASIGGQLFDHGGYQSTLVASAALLGGAALLAFRASRAVGASGRGTTT